eukprot:766932-Hanusia_phi.AAC.6
MVVCNSYPRVLSGAVRREGSLYCWGYDGNTRTTIPAAYASERWMAVRCQVKCVLAVRGSSIDLQAGSSYMWTHSAECDRPVNTHLLGILIPQNFSSVPKIQILVLEMLYYPTGCFKSDDSRNLIVVCTTSILAM